MKGRFLYFQQNITVAKRSFPLGEGGAANFKFTVTDEAIRVIPKTKIRNKTFGGRMIC